MPGRWCGTEDDGAAGGGDRLLSDLPGGGWLDRGELDKIIDRSSPAVALEEPADMRAGRDQPRREDPRREERVYREDRRHDDDGRYSHGKPYRKRKSFLGEIFDFD